MRSSANRPVYPECETLHSELHPTGSCGELDSAASFRDNVEEVNSFREVQFKDGVKVAVPSDINLDSSRVLEFIYNSAPKALNPSREDSEPNKHLRSARSTQGSCESCVLPKNNSKNQNFNKNPIFKISQISVYMLIHRVPLSEKDRMEPLTS